MGGRGRQLIAHLGHDHLQVGLGQFLGLPVGAAAGQGRGQGYPAETSGPHDSFPGGTERVAGRV